MKYYSLLFLSFIFISCKQKNFDYLVDTTKLISEVTLEPKNLYQPITMGMETNLKFTVDTKFPKWLQNNVVFYLTCDSSATLYLKDGTPFSDTTFIRQEDSFIYFVANRINSDADISVKLTAIDKGDKNKVVFT
ncbi:MAG: hypothetical protein ACRCR9_00380, partial [Chitinophagaceae bacterium]